MMTAISGQANWLRFLWAWTWAAYPWGTPHFYELQVTTGTYITNGQELQFTKREMPLW